MTITHLTPQQVNDQLTSIPTTPFVNDTIQLVDVRDHDEIQQHGKIYGALCMSVRSPLFGAALNDLDRNRKVIFQCASGRRSVMAAEMALSQGFTQVYNMLGGFNQWKQEQRPIQINPPTSPWVHTMIDTKTDTAQYIVTDLETRKAVVIDPVLDYDPLLGVVTPMTAKSLVSFINQHELEVAHIIDTHVHADHLTAAGYIKDALDTKPDVWIGKDITKVQQVFAQRYNTTAFEGATQRFDQLVEDGYKWTLGNIQCSVMATPGHTPACISYRIGDAAFVGDTLFMPDLGTARCDFPGGSAHALYNSIQQMYTSWTDDTRIYVGHDYPSDARKYNVMTSLGHQKRFNKMISQDVTLNEFLARRTARDQVLKPPRLIHPSLQTNLRGGVLPDKEKALDNDTEAGSFFKIPVQWQA